MYLGPQQKYPSRFEYFGWHVRTIGARILHRQKDTVIPKYPTAKTLFTGGIKTYKHESNYVFSKMQN